MQASQFLAGRIDYERTQSMPSSEAAFKLDRMRDLLNRLGDPQQGMRIVHVAGTKGKGSTAAMMAAILTAAGYRTGLFTSPHLERVEERIAIDGRPCSAAELAEVMEQLRPAVEAMDALGAMKNPPEYGPTYFEIVTAAALCHFARQRVDAAVLEVGLGGRLDSTNVCTPTVSIITTISLDHTKQLGDTLSAIAAEKAGIIKPGVPVISGVTTAEPRDVVRGIARQNGCPLLELGADFDFEYRPPVQLEQSAAQAHFDFRYFARNSRRLTATGTIGDNDRRALPTGYFTDLAMNLLGRHQAANAALVLAAVEELRRSGWTIPEAAVREGLATVVWPARIEVVGRRPTVVLDGAHNAASIEALMRVLDESFSARRRLLVFATTQEKDLRGMLDHLLGQFDHVVFTRYVNNPRGVPAEQLQTLAQELSGVRYPTCASPADAWDAVHRLAGSGDLICITGSFFIAAEMRREVAARPFV